MDRNIILICMIVSYNVIMGEKCNPYATITEIDSFYLTQPFTKNFTMNFKEYLDVFPKLSELASQFNVQLLKYENASFIESAEPVALIPFTPERNAFIVTSEHVSKDSFKKCAENGGTVVKLTPDNRESIVKILKDNNLSKTPVHVMPFYSFMTADHNHEIIHTPDDFKQLQASWVRTPPYLTKNNEIETGHLYTDKNETEVTGVEEFSSPIVCTKPNNPWDLPEYRKKWLQTIPRIRNAIKAIDGLKPKYDAAMNTLKKIPTITEQAAKLFSLTIPEPVKSIMDFLNKFSKQKHWEKVDNVKPFIEFADKALKLTKQLKHGKVLNTGEMNGFTPISIDEHNWRESLELDDSVYGIMGPVNVKLLSAIEGQQNFLIAITARIYHKIKDKVVIYSVRPNNIYQRSANIKTIVESGSLRVALPHEVKILQCATKPDEHLKVCHKLSIQPTPGLDLSDLEKCADALMSHNITKKFDKCPLIKADSVPSLYRADCEPDHTPTAIINSDSPVTLKFVCNDKQVSYANITDFPTMIPTPCEVRLVKNGDSILTLPQWNDELLQKPEVGQQIAIEIPKYEIPDYLLYTIYAGIAFVSLVIFIIFIIICVKCCKCCCRGCRSSNNQNDAENPQNNVPPHDENRYIPIIRMHEFPFTE